MSKLSTEQIELLRRPVFAHVATVMADGAPQSTPVWIDTDGEAVLFNTAKGRTKTRNLEETATSVLPQALFASVSSTLYILDVNIHTATIPPCD